MRDDRTLQQCKGRELDEELIAILFPNFDKQKVVNLAEKVRSSLLDGIQKNTYDHTNTKHNHNNINNVISAAWAALGNLLEMLCNFWKRQCIRVGLLSASSANRGGVHCTLMHRLCV